MISRTILLALLISTAAGFAGENDRGWIPLFNGKNLDGWYTFRQADGKNNDKEQIFKVEDGMIHVLDVPDITKSQPNGYAATNEEFRNYHLRLQYKWGEKKLPVPRHPEGLPRDAGMLFHMYGADAVWPQCVEFQIQEHDTGDVWLLNRDPRPTVNSTVATTEPSELAQRGVYNYMAGGTTAMIPAVANGQRLKHSTEYDSLTDWNTIELYATNDEAVYVVNGHVNNRIKQIRIGPSGNPITQGRILLQAENNEIFYRNVEIQPLFASNSGGPAYKVLAFSKTAGFRHASIPDGVAALKKLGDQFGFSVDATEDSAVFADENLKQYKVIIFLSTTGDVLNDAQQKAMENYMHAGGGYVGVHAASDTEYDWPWYGKLVGAYFSRHPSGTPTATVHLEDPNQPCSSSLPMTWTRADEWYEFKSNPRGSVHVVATLDEKSYTDGQMGADHPITWFHEFEGGRSWYTAMGHTKESFTDPLFLFQLLGGIQYAAGQDGSAPSGTTVLFDGKDASHWVDAKGAAIAWPVHDGVLESKTRAGDIHTKETYTDFQLHVEFKVPVTNPPHTNNAETNEQAQGNSGVYLQGRYEAQILDSFDHPLEDQNDIGAIYKVKDALVNAGLPAETWQSYDITFHSAKWDGARKTTNAHATFYLNGRLVQDNTEIPHFTTKGNPEGPEPGPIMLQDHLNPVQFRNIWIKPISDSGAK